MDSKVKLLVVEDDPVQRLLIEKALTKSPDWLDYATEATLADAQAAIYHNSYDIIISDYILPDGKGTDLIDKENYPLVVMTSQGSQQIAAEIMKSGAHDYLVKSQELFTEFPHIVKRTMREWALEQQNKTIRNDLSNAEGLCFSLFREFPDPLIITGRTGVIKMANQKAVETLGVEGLENSDITDILNFPEDFYRTLKTNGRSEMKISARNKKLSVNVNCYSVSQDRSGSNLLYIFRKT